jgi:hypothetical protein
MEVHRLGRISGLLITMKATIKVSDFVPIGKAGVSTTRQYKLSQAEQSSRTTIKKSPIFVMLMSRDLSWTAFP